MEEKRKKGRNPMVNDEGMFKNKRDKGNQQKELSKTKPKTI